MIKIVYILKTVDSLALFKAKIKNNIIFKMS